MKLKDKFISLIYPDSCLNCGKLISDGYFCKNCSGLVMPITVNTCNDCGLPLKFCACKWNFFYFDEIISCFEGTEEAKNSFYSFKFRGNFTGGGFFSNEMARRVGGYLKLRDLDIITSVPSHSTTIRERCYDQTKVLARRIAKQTKLSYKPLLIQPYLTPKQHESDSIEQRYTNVQGKYKIKARQNIKGKNILLVDDIKTTGATLSECARELKLAGAAGVTVITALTIYPKTKNN